jgi:hypothetical protein
MAAADPVAVVQTLAGVDRVGGGRLFQRYGWSLMKGRALRSPACHPMF